MYMQIEKIQKLLLDSHLKDKIIVKDNLQINRSYNKPLN